MFDNILIVDYSGHPFQIQLSKELARRGNRITHAYCSSFTTPKGNTDAEDIENFDIKAIALKKQVNKTNFLKRRAADVEFGIKLRQLIIDGSHDLVILSNLPIDSIKIVQQHLKILKIPYIYWLQDIYSIAMKAILKKKLSILGLLVAEYYRKMEIQALENASGIIAITKDFIPILEEWGIKTRKFVIPNWAPIDELPLVPKVNAWSLEQGLSKKKIILYSGTLGYKHNPELLVRLSKSLNQNQILLVISEGPVADKLKEEQIHNDNLKILPFQKFSNMPSILGTADVLVGVLEKEAGVFSVPSKVLTYLTAGKPIVLSVPAENLASKIISENNVGYSVDPDNGEEFVEKCIKLISDLELGKQKGLNGRKYAEKYFNVRNIADNFQEVINNI